MKIKFTVAMLSALALSLPAHAQLGGFSNPLGGGKSAAPAVDTDSVKKAITNALASLSYANGKYAEALGKETEAAQLKEIGDKLSSGSLGVSSDVIASVKTASSSLEPEIKKQMDEKKKLSDGGKKAAADGLAYHVKGTVGGVASSKLLKKAFESKSPMVLGALADFKDFPTLFSQWTSATGTIFSYMKFNGIDVKQADKSIADAMKDS